MPYKKFLLLVGLVGIAIAAWYFFSPPSSQKKRIAITSFANIVVHEYAASESKKCAEALGLEVVTLTASSADDKSLIDSVCNTALQAQPDCIIAVGRTFAQTLVNVARRRGLRVPIVFMGVQQPVEVGLVSSLEQPGGAATGVAMGNGDLAFAPRLLELVVPQIKNVLVAYYSVQEVPEIRQQRLDIESYLQARGVNVLSFGIDSLSDALMRLEARLDGIDAVVTLEADFINEWNVHGMVHLMRRRKIPYFSRQMAAAELGAPFTFAFEHRYNVEAAFELVKKIIFEGANPATTPVIKVETGRVFIVNIESARQLGIVIDEEALLEAIAADPVLACVKDRVRFIER